MKSDKGHTARWSAPEILFGECITSRQADIFAFGMVVVEVRALSEDHHNAMDRILTPGICWFPYRYSRGTSLSTPSSPAQ